MTDRFYWATAPVEDIGDQVRTKAREYRTYCETSGRAAMWRRAMLTLYGLDANGSYRNSAAITFSGSDGENVNLRLNHYATLANATTVMATSKQIAYTCRAGAYDAAATEAVQIGNAVLDSYHSKGARRTVATGMDYAVNYGDAAVFTTWDQQTGPIIPAGPPQVDPMTGQPMKQETRRDGDVSVRAYRPDEVIRDVNVLDWDHDWVIVQERHNRWDLAAQYPDSAQHIIGAPSFDSDALVSSLWGQFWTDRTTDADQIICYVLYHRATPALPEGRATIVVDGKAIADDVNPYGEDLPVTWIVPKPETGTAFGYGVTWDLLAPSVALDSVVSMAVTMEENYGLINIVAPQNADVDDERISKGTRVIYSNVTPSPIEAMSAGVDNAISMAKYLQEQMTQMRSLNDAMLGSGASTPSGASFAMQKQISEENNAGSVTTYVDGLLDVSRKILKCVQKFATLERAVTIVGRNNTAKAKRWKADTLGGLTGVDLELGAPEMRSTAMRHQVINEFLQAGLIQDPTVALEMYSTGRLEPAFDGPQALEAAVERENEMLMTGAQVLVLEADNHPEHIRRHKTLLNDPEARTNPALVQMVEEHCNMHAVMWNNLSMDLIGMAKLAACQIPPSPAAQMMQAMGAAAMPPSPPPEAEDGQDMAEPTQNPDVSTPNGPPGPVGGPQPNLPPDARAIPAMS